MNFLPARRFDIEREIRLNTSLGLDLEMLGGRRALQILCNKSKIIKLERDIFIIIQGGHWKTEWLHETKIIFYKHMFFQFFIIEFFSVKTTSFESSPFSPQFFSGHRLQFISGSKDQMVTFELCFCFHSVPNRATIIRILSRNFCLPSRSLDRTRRKGVTSRRAVLLYCVT